MDKDVDIKFVMAIKVGNYPNLNIKGLNFKQYLEAEMLEIDYEKGKNKNKLV